MQDGVVRVLQDEDLFYYAEREGGDDCGEAATRATYADYGSVATGRVGSAHHSLHEPG